MAKKEYTISDIYQGGYSSLNSSYGKGDFFTGYKTRAGGFGLTTDPRSANMLQEVSSKLATGVKQIELTGIQPDIFESIPEQHLKEINRLSKITGVDISVHAPLVEASGITRDGFSEESRREAERQIWSAVERSHEINPSGNINVTFHSSAGIPQPVTPEGEKTPSVALIINEERGSIHPIPLTEKKFPGEKKEIDPYEEIKKRNEEQWSEGIRSMSHYADRGREVIKPTELLAREAEIKRATGRELSEQERDAESSFRIGKTFLDDSYRQMKALFEMAHKNGSSEDKKILNDFANRIEPKVKRLSESKDEYEYARKEREIIDEGIKEFEKIKPQIFKPLDDFAKSRTAQTFANVALESYNKFHENSPIISIENPPAGGAFSTGKELREIIEEARKKFEERAVSEGMSRENARKTAEKIIGATWDVGHINMLKKYGYKDEDIVKETKEISPFVKHIHLSDNFGLEHTELPMGMGNVPIKEILEQLPEKDVKKIIEAGNWWQHFKTPPFKETLEAFGSPLYSMDMAPYWNQSQGLQQGYYSGLGMMLPQINYETFGAGFSQLPTELGGQRQGAEGGRMSGRQME